MERMRIVIADKDLTFRKNLRDMLTKAGYFVVGEAEDGASALKLIHSTQPEVVLTAANLPVVNGLELLRIIEEEKLAAAIIMVEYGEKDILYRVGEKWSVPVLVKPFDELNMVSIIEYSYNVYTKLMDLELEVHRLKNDLETRKTVERAKGILMKAHNLTEEEAFKRIQQQSMKKRTSMKNIAKAIITVFEMSGNGTIQK